MSGHWPAGGTSRPPNGGTGGPPFNNWGRQPAPQHSRQQEMAKQEAQRKRKQQAAQAAEAQKRKEGHDHNNKDLFAAPTRATAFDGSGDVERVFGSFSEAHKGGLIHNTYKDNYFGVDYLPPTPAPAKEHFIGDEEEESSTSNAHSHSTSNGGGRSNPNPYNRPAPPSTARPSAPKPAPRPSHNLKPPPVPMGWGQPPTSMAPPGGQVRGPSGPPHSKGPPPRPTPQARSSKPNLAPLVLEKSSVNSSFEDDDVEPMLAEMKNPFRNIPDLGGLPTPLTALAPTPQVDFEERGSQRHKPVYQVPSGLGFDFNSSEPPSKPSSPPPIQATSSPTLKPPKIPIVTKDSSSSDSSSDSESGETDPDLKASESDEDDGKKDYSLAAMVMATKNSPKLGSLSDRSNKPSPSPGYPTPSPKAYITPSPSGVLPLPSPSSLPKPEGGGISIPPLLPPLSPPPYPLSPLASPTKQITQDLKLNKQGKLQPSSEEEEAVPAPPKPRSKQPTKKPRKTSKNSIPASKIKSVSVVPDDSDSDSPVPSSKRSLSVSPQKRPKPQLSQPRPTSTHSTPARGSSKTSSKAPKSHSSANSSPKVMPGRPLLSASDSEVEEEKVPEKSAPAPDTTKKSSIKNAIFGRMLGGGKGKGKGGNKGGIKVVYKEDESSSSREKRNSSSSPVQVVEEKPPPSPKMIGEPIKSPKPSSQRSNRENSQNWGNLPGDLQFTDEDDGEIISPKPTAPPPQPLVSRSSSSSSSTSSSSSSKRRPSIIVSIPLSRLGKTLVSLQTRFRGHTSKLSKKSVLKEGWITSEEEPGSGGRKRKISEKVPDILVNKLTPSEPRHDHDSRVRHGSDSSSSTRSSRSLPQHRKVTERTHGDLSDKEVVGKDTNNGTGLGFSSSYNGSLNGGELESCDRKRRDRDLDLEDEAVSKRLKSEEDELEVGPSNMYYPTSDGLSVMDGNLPPAHPTWPGCLMPPPTMPTQRVYYSYFERRHQDEDFQDEDNVVEGAKRLKHKGDDETNLDTKLRLYLQAIMLFSVHGSLTESKGDKITAYNMYKQTLQLIKDVMKGNNSKKNIKKEIDIRLIVMSMRAQSLLNLRLYKMKRHELKDYQKAIQDALAQSGVEEGEQQPGNQMSPTPSPAGSEGSNCSKSSGYTSSGENRLSGVLTPPTAPPICLSIPKNVIRNQYDFCSYLSQCHELWEQADLYVSKGQCEDFFILLDQECGPLTLHSSLKDLVNYTRKGLSTLSEDRRTTEGPLPFYQGGLPVAPGDELKDLK